MRFLKLVAQHIAGTQRTRVSAFDPALAHRNTDAERHTDKPDFVLRHRQQIPEQLFRLHARTRIPSTALDFPKFDIQEKELYKERSLSILQ
jgi:hypothetical protein